MAAQRLLYRLPEYRRHHALRKNRTTQRYLEGFGSNDCSLACLQVCAVLTVAHPTVQSLSTRTPRRWVGHCGKVLPSWGCLTSNQSEEKIPSVIHRFARVPTNNIATPVPTSQPRNYKHLEWERPDAFRRELSITQKKTLYTKPRSTEKSYG